MRLVMLAASRMTLVPAYSVIPAQAGPKQPSAYDSLPIAWVPTFVGMTLLRDTNSKNAVLPAKAGIQTS